MLDSEALFCNRKENPQLAVDGANKRHAPCSEGGNASHRRMLKTITPGKTERHSSTQSSPLKSPDMTSKVSPTNFPTLYLISLHCT